MERENTAIRISRIMAERNLRQVDILERAKPFCIKYDIKMNKSDLSQYVSGKVEPSQEKLVILGMALNVSEAWLMGFDVPMERTASTKEESPKIMQYYELLNDIGKYEATKRVEELTHLQKYTKEGENNTVEFSEELTDEKDYLIPNAAHQDEELKKKTKKSIKEEEDIMDDENF